MIEFTKEQWSIIFLSIAVLVQWGVIINILGRMERLRQGMQMLNKQNKTIARNVNDLCTLTKWWARIEEEDKA